jgi:hypothetical protein
MAPAASTSGGSLFSIPDYDSGWVEIAANSSEVFEHHLGGDTDDYVLKLDFWDREGSAGGFRIHNWAYGGDYGGDATQGVHWVDLNDHDVTVVREFADVRATAVRVRIWVMPGSDYDSGWQAMEPGEDRSFAHNLGGDVDDYVVDMQFRAENPDSGVNHFGYGGDRSSETSEWGAYWHSLTASSITAHRGSVDCWAAAEIRMRIWRKPNPDWDSGWWSISTVISWDQRMGGPWNDLVVDLQFRDADGGYGVNQRGYGGDRWEGIDPDTHGAYWSDLTSCGVRVDIGAEDTAADEVRVRIWGNRTPKYDSGWYPLAQGDGHTFQHDLGGTPDGYVLDLQFRDTAADGVTSTGVNQRSYGADYWYDHANARYKGLGASWASLTEDSVLILRYPDDHGADEVRLRMWLATGADYDSGWQTITDSLTLNHNIGGYPRYYVVDLQFRDWDGAFAVGVNNGFYGGDNRFEDGVTPRAYGAFWHSLTDSSITVSRHADADIVDEVRVRIWYNNNFDYASDWRSIGTISTFNHNLATCPDGLVVDLQFESDDDTYGVHQKTYGGDSIYGFGELHQYGAHWQALTSRAVEVYRQPKDTHVDRARIRIWNTPGCRVHVPLVVRD